MREDVKLVNYIFTLSNAICNDKNNRFFKIIYKPVAMKIKKKYY